MIDATISEVTLNHALAYGVQWYFQKSGPYNSAALTQGQNTPPSLPSQVFPALSYMYQSASATVVLNALATVTDVSVLSAPKLMVLNNHTATIQVGDQVPISTGSATSTLTSGAPIVNSIEYRDTGVILKVTPRVNSGGLVLLDIAQEVSDVVPPATTGSSSSTSSQTQSPTFNQRKIAKQMAQDRNLAEDRDGRATFLDLVLDQAAQCDGFSILDRDGRGDLALIERGRLRLGGRARARAPPPRRSRPRSISARSPRPSRSRMEKPSPWAA